MKKTILALAVALAFTACSKDDDSPAGSGLIGTWENTEEVPVGFTGLGDRYLNFIHWDKVGEWGKVDFYMYTTGSARFDNFPVENIEPDTLRIALTGYYTYSINADQLTIKYVKDLNNYTTPQNKRRTFVYKRIPDNEELWR